jgi:broad specificity phosphatase PhoE
MDILLVRHGESEGNVAGRIQGNVDSPLTDLGRAQAARLGKWLRARGLRWSAAYASPLVRARDTAAIIAEQTGYPAAVTDEDLREVGVGRLEGLTRDEIFKQFPRFVDRGITELGDFEEFGGDSYDGVQARAGRVLERLERQHRPGADVVLVVAHGGINFQIAKAAVCVPVPRVCILHWGNCTATLLRFRERRGTYMAEVTWHVPIDLMGGEAGAGSTGAFR